MPAREDIALQRCCEEVDNPVVVFPGTAVGVRARVGEGEGLCWPRQRALEDAAVASMVEQKVLVVEDADSLREVLQSVLLHEGYQVLAVPDAEAAIAAIEKESFSCVLADFKLPGMNGIELLRAVRERHAALPFLLMTAFGSIEIAVEAMKLGATDFITKPFEPERLCGIVHDVITHHRVLDRSGRRRGQRRFLTRNEQMEQVREEARRVARVNTSVLILGESGTGKELIARYIHEHSPRADKPFVAINCAAMPAELLESEFFGHEAGAFTGATQSRAGVFEVASEGTLFLDEIGEMPKALQVKLLRALQEFEIKRVGGNEIIKVNPRIIAATNQKIPQALDNGAIREDLFYRLAVVTLELPPLRERPEDIPLIADYYRELFCSRFGKQLDWGDDAMELLVQYPWPGNARELENVIERAVILADAQIDSAHLGLRPNLDTDSLGEASRTLHEISQQAAKEAEVQAIRRALVQADGNKTRAAQLLGVSYKTLLNKVRDYELDARIAPDASVSEA